MADTIIVKGNINEPMFNRHEALRYAGCLGEVEPEVENMLDACLKEILPVCSYRYCYQRVEVLHLDEKELALGELNLVSEGLARNLRGCREAFVFGATIGVDVDRLIQKYGRLEPSKGLFMQAIGAERIEALCDELCQRLASDIAPEGLRLRPRFSPGYGDLALDVQQGIFAMLDLPRNAGISLNDSLLMSPSKSVTAIAGIGLDMDCDENGADASKCMKCSKIDCEFRRV